MCLWTIGVVCTVWLLHASDLGKQVSGLGMDLLGPLGSFLFNSLRDNYIALHHGDICVCHFGHSLNQTYFAFYVSNSSGEVASYYGFDLHFLNDK